MLQLYQLSDYERLAGWFSGWQCAPPHIDTLPATGFIVGDVMAGWIYLTNSRMALIENVVSNPSSTREERESSFPLLIGALLVVARDAGYDHIRSTTTSPMVMDIGVRFGAGVSQKTIVEINGVM